MQQLDSYLADRVLTRQLYLMRFSAGEQKKVLAVLVDMRAELVAKLRVGNVTDFARGRLKTLLKQCEAVIDHGYGQIQTTLDFEGLAKVEAEATIRPLAAVGLEATLPTTAAMKALINGSVIEGAPSNLWWKKQSEDLQFKFAAQVRQGVSQGETLMDIVRRVAGSKRLGTAGIMEVARRNAFSLVHTSVMQVAADARLATFRQNADIIKGVRQLSVLDGHTSLVCVARSGAEWDLNGNPIKGKFPFQSPPLHFNCRSVLTPITLTYRELGIDRPELPVGTRASDEGQVRADITMAEWLKSKPKEYVDDLLGKGRSDLFLSGKITLPQLLDQSGEAAQAIGIEGAVMKYRLIILWWSFLWIFRVNLGDVVLYAGKEYTVCNGVRCESWRLGGLENGDSGWVRRSECRKVWTLKNVAGSFRSGYGFYMSNWFDIWKREGIKPWMRGCNIFP